MTDAWSNFFIAQCGASSALLGLLFVSVSIGLSKILEFPALPGRALTAMILLLAVLLVSCLMLIPAQPSFAHGIETLAIAVPVGAVGVVVGIDGVRAPAPKHRRYFITALLLHAIAILPYFVAGVLLLHADWTALYWLAAAMILSYLKSFLDAWVLLIEIHR